MIEDLKRGILFTLVTMVLFGGVYHGVVWAIGRAVFPAQAEGSLIRREDGAVVGSALIAQAFAEPRYFQPRPSAVDYNAASAGGSNLGPSNPDHVAAMKTRLAAVMAREGVTAAAVPSETITASGAGLDPHIPPAGAARQIARVARARNVSAYRVGALVLAHTETPLLGLFGRARVNVLQLNLALDRELGPIAK